MASADARPVPIKNTAFRLYVPILDADGDPVTGPTALDSEVSLDGAAFDDCTNEWTEIGTSGIGYLDLTASEMNADAVIVRVQTSSSGAKTTVCVLYPEEAGDINVDVTAFGGTVGTFSGGRPEVNTSHIAGSAVSTASAQIGVNVVQVSGDSAAADNAEAFFDGTGYAGTNNVIPTVTTLTNAPSDSSGVTTLLSRLSALRAGYLDNLSAGAVATAAKMLAYFQSALRKDVTVDADIGGTYDDATDSQEAIRDRGDAAWTTATGFSTLDAAGVRTAVGLASANLDTQLTAIDDYLDTEVAAIKAKTDNLPAAPAATGDIPSAATIADAVWDEATAGHVSAGSFGKVAADVLEDTGTTLQAEVDGIQADTEDIQTRLPAALVGGRIDANMGAISSDAVAADNAEAFFDGTGYAGTGNVIPTVTTLTNDPTGVTTLLSRMGTPSNLGGGATLAANLSDIEAQTDDIGTAGAGLTAIPWNTAWDVEVQSEVADALEETLADSIPADGTRPSVKQALYMLTQFMLERSVSSTTVTVRKPDGSTTLFQLSLNDATSPTSITRSA